MSVGAKLLNAGMKLSGIKKKYALPEARFAGSVSEEKRRAAGSLHERGLRKAFDEKAGGGLLCAF